MTGAAVLLGNGAAGSARLIAYWSGTSQPSELRDWLRRRLPARLVPGDLRWLAALPLTGSGKVDHAALAARPEHRERLVDRIELLTDEEAAWLLRMARGQADRPQEPGGRDDRA